jgi:hypothetical protein
LGLAAPGFAAGLEAGFVEVAAATFAVATLGAGAGVFDDLAAAGLALGALAGAAAAVPEPDAAAGFFSGFFSGLPATIEYLVRRTVQ